MRLRPGLGLCLLGWALFPFTVIADEWPIAVDVSFEVATITNAWAPEAQARVRAESKAAIAQQLNNAFRHWIFLEEENQAQFRLTLRLIDPEPQDEVVEAQLRLEVAAVNDGGQIVPGPAWSKAWLSANDIQYRRYPTEDAMVGALQQQLQKLFINDHGVSLGRWLHNSVPVGETAAWLDVPNKYFMVVSIPEDKFFELSESVFRIHAKPQFGLKETLEAWGIGEIIESSAESETAAFSGLAVQISKRLVAGNQLDLAPEVTSIQQLGPVFLHDQDPYSDFDADIDVRDRQ